MQVSGQKSDLSDLASFNGIDVKLISTDKFKTDSVSFFFQDDLREGTAALNALIPAVLRRGTAKHPSFKEIASRLQELYGASFDCGIAKKGERQLILFYIEFVSERFVETGKGAFEEAFDLLFEIIAQPYLENNVFKKGYLELEKQNLKELIGSRVNNKLEYAVDRCLEEMCSGEPFGVYEYGRAEGIESIDSGRLYSQYAEMLQKYPLQVFLTGDFKAQQIDYAIKRLKELRRGRVRELSLPSAAHRKITEIKNISEPMEVSQGKLSLGFRSNISADSPERFALLVYNGILGGGPHSKLFQNVREKASLAYYVFSRLEKFKGLMLISSGIETANRQKAEDIIMEQFEEMKRGNITDNELAAAKKHIETGLQSLKDNHWNIVDFYLGQAISGTEDTLDIITEKVRAVEKNEVVRLAGKIEPDTVYFLEGKNAGNSAEGES